MGDANRKLPRGPQPPPADPSETIRKAGGADLQNGWLARHGTLTLTDSRVVFTPTLLDRLLRARRHAMSLDEITEVERWPVSPGMIPPGAKRPRLLVHTPACVYELMVGDLDGWFDAFEKVYQLRARREPGSHQPAFTREGVENLMLAEE